MPLYDFKCPSCQHVSIDVFRKMNSETVEACPVCTAAMEKLPSLPHTDLHEFHTPITMFSIALDNDDEIREFKKKCPDVDVSMDPNHPDYGLPIARNRKQKLNALKAMGYVESN